MSDENDINQLKATHAAETRKLTAELSALKDDHAKTRGKLREYELWTPLKSAYLAAGGDETDWGIVKIDIGNRQLFEVDDDGDIMAIENGKKTLANPKGFFEKVYAAERPKFFKKKSQGQTQTGGGKVVTRGEFDQMPHGDRMSYIRAGGKVVD